MPLTNRDIGPRSVLFHIRTSGTRLVARSVLGYPKEPEVELVLDKKRKWSIVTAETVVPKRDLFGKSLEPCSCFPRSSVVLISAEARSAKRSQPGNLGSANRREGTTHDGLEGSRADSRK